MGLKGGKGNQGQGQYNGYCYQSEQRQRTASRQQQCATTVGSGNTWQSRALKREKERKAREKVGWWSQKGKGKGKGLQSVSEWD